MAEELGGIRQIRWSLSLHQEGRMVFSFRGVGYS